ncbi:CaiB/BaiF CoA transferase family protein [Chloroflexota bacterium]
MKVLEGVRVIELAVYGQGPVAAGFLGDLGAEVIKIEHPTMGDPMRGNIKQWGTDRRVELRGGGIFHHDFEMCNRSKKGITLDVHHPKGKETIYRLIEKSDVFLSNLREKGLQSFGLSYDEVRRINPRIIYAHTTGFGPKGPLSRNPAMDIVGMARGGAMFWASELGGEPVYPVGAIYDVGAAIMTAFGIVAALLVRERSGIGQRVDVSQLGTGINWNLFNVYTALAVGTPYRKLHRSKEPEPLFNVYKCKDDRWICLGMLASERYWPQFCKAIDQENLQTAPKFHDRASREKNCQELIAILDQIFLQKTADEWLAIMDKEDLVCGRVQTFMDLATDEQALANDYIIEVDHPVLGHIKFPGIPITFSETPMKFLSFAPEFGQHTEEILSELCGYTWEQMDEMRSEHII